MTSVIIMRQGLIIESEHRAPFSEAIFAVYEEPMIGLSRAYSAVLDIVARDALVSELSLNRP
tara:strand:+ start:686 stop:871 length:186 start_codon:yes stop_codon:yes gene_type:complete